MKRIYFLPLILCLIFLGCSDKDLEQTNSRNLLFEKPHFTITESEALAVALDAKSDLINNLDKARTLAKRSMPDSVGVGDIFTLTMDDLYYEGEGASGDYNSEDIDTILYIVNYGTDQGYALVSADKRIANGGIVALIEEGHLSPDSVINCDGMKLFIDCYRDFIHAQLDSATTYPWSNKMSSTPWTAEYVDAALMATQWHQFEPYNQYCYTIDSTQAVVGCVALAIGQIMAKHMYPPSYKGKTIHWPLFALTSEPYGPHGEGEAAWLLHEIGLLVNTTYGDTLSTANSENAASCFQTMGYTYTYMTQLPDTSAIIHDLGRGNPIFIAGRSVRTSNYSYNAHAWVIDGCYTNSRTRRVYGIDNLTYTTFLDKEFFVHCNWGWRDNGNGNSNGYYHYGVFQVHNYYFVKNWKVYINIQPSE